MVRPLTDLGGVLLDSRVQARDDSRRVSGLNGLGDGVHGSGSRGNSREDREGRDQEAEELHLEGVEGFVCLKID